MVAFARATDEADALAAPLPVVAARFVAAGVGVQTGSGVGLAPGVALTSDAPIGPFTGGSVAVGGKGVGEGDTVPVTITVPVGEGEGVAVLHAPGVSVAAVA